MFEINKGEFGAFVAQLRKEQGLTQKELGEKLFLSDKAVSKWETGVSIPDTALLVPLAQILGVTVTELLLCQRMQAETELDSAQVEDVVKAALAYPEESRAWQSRSWWPAVYLLCALAGGALTMWCYGRQLLSDTALTVYVLGLIFGAYFCFFVKNRLPGYYDQNACGVYYDGPFRMNVPGVRFTNANWPYMVRVGRIWSCCVMVLASVMELLGDWIIGSVWLAALLGGLFGPMYILGKRHE